LPGTQAAIARLPYFLPATKVALPAIGYNEHQRAWIEAGHTPVFYRDLPELLTLVTNGLVDHAVVIHPNNPTGDVLNECTLQIWAAACCTRWHVDVDEAVDDVLPAQNLAFLLTPLPNLLVLRSMGKFFEMTVLCLGFFLRIHTHTPIKQLTPDLTPSG